MPCDTELSTSLKQNFLCLLEEFSVVHRDCDGVIHGDCSMCAGEEGGDIVANIIIFNPANNQLVSTVNGIASATTITMDTGDITLVGDLVVGGVTYTAGTNLHSVLSAIIALNHPAASVAVGSNPALTANTGTQQFSLNLDAPGSYDNSVSGLVSTSVQDAIDEVAANASAFPAGSAGDILIHNGIEYISCEEHVEIFNNQSGVSFNLSQMPISFVRVAVYRNGILMVSPDDYTRSGVSINLVRVASNETFTAIYYRAA